MGTRARLAVWGAVVAALAAAPAVLSPLQWHFVWDTAAWAVAVLGLNLVVGFAGEISLGHAAFMGTGAYTAVILAADHGWPLAATLPAALVVTGVLGFVIGVPALRFHGLYLAFVTLAVGAAFNPLVKRLRSITNGSDGKLSKRTLKPPSFIGTSRDAQRLWIYIVVVGTAVVVFVLAANLVRGRLGRAMAALRHDELSAVAFGVPVRHLRRVMFAVSAGVTGLAGALLMMPSPFAVEANFTETVSFQLYAAVYLGGIGALSGSVVGGAVIVALPFATKWFGITLVPTLIYGAALVLVTVFVPDGIVGTLQRAWTAARARRRGRPAGDTPLPSPS